MAAQAEQQKHPIGLAVLAATELAERFSYYGMTALLALYMVKQLLLPGHAEHVIGLAALRSLFEFRGPMSDQAFASLIYGWYGGLVYFTPLLGGWVADRWLGKKATVIIGALLMAGGHLAMTFDQSFLLALLLLVLGSGALKGNISAQVGTLYPKDAESMRARGFPAGFGIAAALMLLALAIDLLGSRSLPASRPVSRETAALPALTREEKRRTWALIGLIALTILPNIAYPMIWNIGIIWVDQRVDLATALGSVPASWFTSVDPFASIVIAAPLIALWRWQSRRGLEPSGITKMAIGSAITALSALLFTAGCLSAGADGKISVLWALAGYFGMGIAFMWYWPITLTIISQAAPAKVNSTMMGGAFLSLFVGVVLMGWVGSFYQQMSNAAFWILDAAIGFAGAVLLLAVRRPLGRLVEPPKEPAGAPAYSPG
jgi:POT family proton-dependent oligopeptide transporter